MKINHLRNPATFVNSSSPLPPIFLTRGYAKDRNMLLRDTHPLAHFDVRNRNNIAESSLTYHIF